MSYSVVFSEKDKDEDDRMMALSKEERIPYRMMDLSKEERIELVLLSGREGWSYRKIAEEFSLRHPYSVVGVDGGSVTGNCDAGSGCGGSVGDCRVGGMMGVMIVVVVIFMVVVFSVIDLIKINNNNSEKDKKETQTTQATKSRC
ncbi:Hypothetical predicted protein [Octopus vulgaris]|uniref:Uncharacterized protein n=1 Tax=Octopus vulgaris TaxID=6645 RepID=A0AA36AR66_OCTVU|nr:Hypothetical predicted protein [Octopus vulgaris]